MVPDDALRAARARALHLDDAYERPLVAWFLVALPAGHAASPDALDARVAGDAWLPALVPGTAASALRDAGRWSVDAPARDFDAEDWWWRCRFAADVPGVRDGAAGDGRVHVLRLDGLATIADAWLNGEPLLSSESMWLAHEVDVTARLRPENELVIRCAALGPYLAACPVRPRPRWRTSLVERQALRWVRTTFLGRMPGWCPAAAPVGPWRGVSLVTRDALALGDVSLRPALDGDDGVLDVTVELLLPDGRALPAARVRVAGVQAALAPVASPASSAGRATLAGRVRVSRVARWWPHTHGTPVLHDVALELVDGTGGAPAVRRSALGRVGFRTVDVDRGADGDGFTLRVNGVAVFARGACWTPMDVATLGGDAATYAAAIADVRAAGANMLRIGGTMAYEHDAFWDACDAAGVLVWQDFMLANLDYPAGDARFGALVRAEAAQQLGRVAHRPALAVLCGGSEMAQQAAMLGLPSSSWDQPVTEVLLREACAALAPGVPYVADSPAGGALPFHADRGVTHYYGVGAYRRPLEDARRAGVRFASECLAFAHVPSPATVERAVGPLEAAVEHPRWKARVPRDRGADWDFEDVRDHYLRLVLDVDPVALRRTDPARYLALSRVATGEVMSRTYAEWRRAGLSCGGALVWLLRDLAPGAGWGVLDDRGAPKAAWRFLARAWAPVAVLATDEGVNGVRLHVANDRADAFDGTLEVALWRDGHLRVADGHVPVHVAAHATTAWAADALVGRFTDVSYAYRFGPPGHDLVTASLRDADGRRVGEAFHFPLGLAALVRDAGDAGDAGDAPPLTAVARRADGEWTLHVASPCFAAAVSIEVDGFTADDDHFHLAPGDTRIVALRRAHPAAAAVPAGVVRALGARDGSPVTCDAVVPPIGSGLPAPDVTPAAAGRS